MSQWTPFGSADSSVPKAWSRLGSEAMISTTTVTKMAASPARTASDARRRVDPSPTGASTSECQARRPG